MGDTGFDVGGNAKAETAVGPELYASLYAHGCSRSLVVVFSGPLSRPSSGGEGIG